MTFDCLNNINSPLNSSNTGNYRHKLSQKQDIMIKTLPTYFNILFEKKIVFIKIDFNIMWNRQFRPTQNFVIK
jgi:hypothetical protein